MTEIPTIVPKKPWANPEEVDKAMEKVIEISRDRGLNSIVVVGELPTGQVWTISSRTEDRFKLAGALMQMAMNLLGFDDKDAKK